MSTRVIPMAKPLTALKECPRCLFTSDIAKIGERQCEYCDLQDALRNQSREPFQNVVNRIRKAGEGKQYDVLVGISGGEDSSVLLYLTAKVWNLRPLVIHFDNHWNSPKANNNIDLLVKNLNVNFIRYYVDNAEYDRINDAFLAAGVQDADITNDVAMARLMDITCKQYGIKYIFNGHDFRKEGSSPAAWSRIDSKYLESVYEWYTGMKIKNYPLYTIWHQIIAGLCGIKQIRPYHYEHIDRTEILDVLKSWGWQWYGSKHAENVYTEMVGCFLLPRKFGIDKRRTYLSAQIREGAMNKEDARAYLAPMDFNTKKLGQHEERILRLIDSSRIRSRDQFRQYNFKKWRIAFWILAKMKIVPHTLYAKYCR